MNNERQQQIVQLLESKGDIQLQQLKEIFPDVSIMTLRRDLISLENEGLLIRTHGGAVSVKKLSVFQGEENAYSYRASENVDAKLKIAEKALRLVEKGRSLYFDAGSTIMCLARMLPDDGFSIITSGANIALELVKRQKTSVVTLGGFLNRNTLSMSGPYALTPLDTVNIDLAFMSASGFSIESGFTVSNIFESELKRKVITRAKKVIMLMDTSKINKSLPFTFAMLENVDVWITERSLPAMVESEARKTGIEVL